MSLKSNKQKGTLPKREEEKRNEKKNHHSIKARFFSYQFLFHPFKSQSGKSKRSDALYFDLRVVANDFPSLKK